MDHIAIDLGGRESQICVRREDGEIAEELRYATRNLPAWLKRRAKGRVILETSAEAFGIADAAVAAGHEVRIVPAHLVRTLGVGARGIKTDKRDARALSEVSCRIDLPSVHLPTHLSRRYKALCGARDTLVETRTKCINGVHSWLRTQLTNVRSGQSKRFPDRVRNKLLNEETGMPSFVDGQLTVVDEMSKQIAIYDQEIEHAAKNDEICRRLMTVPGVGPITSLRFRAALDDIARFEGAHAVGAYLGLTPGEDSSSDRKRRTKITKAGPSRVRRVLVQASWTLIRTRPNDPIVQWATAVAQRRGHRVAVVALARKLAGVLYAIWRDGSSYDPAHGQVPRTDEEVKDELASLVGSAAP